MTNRWNKMPFLNLKPSPRVAVTLVALIMKGTATKPSRRT